MSITLHPFQQDIIGKIEREARAGSRSILTELMTGGGKTTIFSEITRRASEKNKRVMLMVHRREIVDQIVERLRLFGIDPGIIAPGGGNLGTINVASVQTLVGRLGEFEQPDILITDEAHHATAGSWRKISTAWPYSMHLGYTATPCRTDGTGLGDIYQTMVNGPKPRWLRDHGYLVQDHMFAPSVLDLAGVRQRHGDYAQEDLERAIQNSTIIGDAISSFRKFLGPQDTAIAFCCSVEHARRTAAAFKAAGIPVGILTGEDARDDRLRTIDDLASGRIRVLFSVSVVSEGFDLPSIRAAIYLRPTQSLSLYLQQGGRAIRASKGKSSAVIIDHVGNIMRHGGLYLDREWTLEGESKKKRNQDITEEGERTSIRQCMNCYAIHEPAPVCPYCGHEHPVETRISKERAGELRRIDEETLERIEQERKRADRIAQAMAKTEEDLVRQFMAKGSTRKNAHIRARIILKSRADKDRLSIGVQN